MLSKEELVKALRVYQTLRESSKKLFLNTERVYEIRVLDTSKRGKYNEEVMVLQPYISEPEPLTEEQEKQCVLQVCVTAPVRFDRHPRAEWREINFVSLEYLHQQAIV